MKKLCIIFILIITSCTQQKNNESQEQQLPYNYITNKQCNEFLALFKELRNDTMFIYSSDEYDKPSNLKFEGKLISTDFYTIFGESYTGDTSNIALEGARYYACYKRKLSKNIYLLIMRGPALYIENNIYIYFLDKKIKRTFALLLAAKEFGDAGATESIKSDLTIKKDKILLKYYKLNSYYPTDSESICPTKVFNTTYEDTSYTYELTSKGVRIIN